MHEIHAVVATGKRQPVAIETILVPDPGPGDIASERIGLCDVERAFHKKERGEVLPSVVVL